MKKRRTLLIIDAQNMFYRGYAAVPSLSSRTGLPTGGIVGSLNIMKKLCRVMRPNAVVFCWDGMNSLATRRLINEDYKANRDSVRFNRSADTLSPEQELQNRNEQRYRLVEYINNLPFLQFWLDDYEADDLVAFFAKSNTFPKKKWRRMIVSNDKDFVQLLDHNTMLYRPNAGKEAETLNVNRARKKYLIHPVNFTVARAMDGDVSDNLPGVPRFGLKTIAKHFPFLCTEKKYSVQDVIDYAEKQNKKTKIKAFENLLLHKKVFRDNYLVMKLDKNSVDQQIQKRLDSAVKNFRLYLNKTKILMMLKEDGIILDIENLFRASKRICVE